MTDAEAIAQLIITPAALMCPGIDPGTANAIDDARAAIYWDCQAERESAAIDAAFEATESERGRIDHALEVLLAKVNAQELDGEATIKAIQAGIHDGLIYHGR